MEIEQYPNFGANMEEPTQGCDCCGTLTEPEHAPFLFLSTEAWRGAATILMGILTPVNEVFTSKYGQIPFSENLDSIGIIPVCLPNDMIQDGGFRERRYVSLKKRYADVRLHIPYEELIRGDQAVRIRLCAQNIAAAITYVSGKDRTLKKEALLSAVEDAFTCCYGNGLRELPENPFR